MESSGIGAYGVLDVTHADRSITAQRALELALGGGMGQAAATGAGAGYGSSSGGSNLPARGSHGDLASASTADGEAGHRDTPLMLDCVGNFRGELQAESRQALAGLSSVGRSSGQGLAAAAAAIAAGGGERAHPVAMRPAAASNASGPQSPCPPKHAGRVTLGSGAGVGSPDAAAAGAGGAGIPRSRDRTVSAAGGADAADAGAGTSYQGGLPYEAKDISRALLIMLSNNIGQLAYLNAVRYNCKHVYFVGNFLRHENTIAMRTLALAVAYWSGSKMEGLFLRHEGYCGALGAFLSTLETVGEGGAAEGGGSSAIGSASDE
jgi:hypothetical protein